MQHLIKLMPGHRDVEEIEQTISRFLQSHPGRPITIPTRNRPQRIQELDGGSLYWVAGGHICCRQRIIDISEGSGDGGTKYALIELGPEVIRVALRRKPASQGWRYLMPTDAPPDITILAEAEGAQTLPSDMQQELAALGLL